MTTASRTSGVLGAVLVAAGGLFAAAALAGRSYPDRTGDVRGGSGPDIVSISVSNTATAIAFRIRFAKAPALRVSTRGRWVDMLLIGVDTPPLGPLPTSPGGEWRGADYFIGTHGPSKSGQLVRAGKSHRPPVTFGIVTVGSTMTFSIPRRALGNPAWFTFSAAAARETEGNGGGVDLAPDRDTYRYSLTS